MKRKKNRARIAWSVGAIILLSLFFVSLARLETIGGQNLFKIRYSLSSDKKSVLKWYSDGLYATHSGNVSLNICDFLISRLRSTQSDEEYREIVRFWAIRGGWNSYFFISALNSDERTKVIELTIEQLDNFSGSECISALIFVEETRTGEMISKSRIELVDNEMVRGFISGGSEVHPEGEEILRVAKLVFQKWWHQPLSEEAKLARSPVIGSEIKIAGLDHTPRP